MELFANICGCILMGTLTLSLVVLFVTFIVKVVWPGKER